MGSLDWWIDLVDDHQADLQTLQKVTGTITHEVFNTSTLRCSSCSRTGLVLLGRTRQSTIISSLLSSGVFSWPKPASRRPDMKHYVQRCSSSCLLLSSKRAFRCCVNNLHLVVVTEMFLHVLPRNRCLCYNRGDVFQQAVTYQWIYMSQYQSCSARIVRRKSNTNRSQNIYILLS
jgi:hypothetical protein